MSNKRGAFAALAFVALVASILACNMPRPAAVPQPPPATVTPYIPATAATPQESQPPPPPPPTANPPEVTPPEATPSLESPTATNTPPPTHTPPPPPATPQPTQPVSAGPLDFDAPQWIYSWEPQADGSVKAVIKITIFGGAPPFTVYHGPNVNGQTTAREYSIEFVRSGCSGIAQSITVQSADGQSVKKDYWIPTDSQPWCTD